jgi:hypothetical protein
MSENLYAKNVKFEELQRAIDGTLAEVDQGKHDEALRKAGVERPTDVKLASGVSITQSQNLSPEEWTQIIVAFSPVAVVTAKDIWKIVIVPKLKGCFGTTGSPSRFPKRARRRSAEPDHGRGRTHVAARQEGLSLQLRSSFYVGSAGFGLMCASPEGPCDDVGGPDASLRKTNSDAPDFLN